MGLHLDLGVLLGEDKKGGSDDNIGLIIGVAVGVGIAVIVVVAVIVGALIIAYIRKKHNVSRRTSINFDPLDGDSAQAGQSL